MQGQKASTAIGRGVTTGALAGVTAGVLSKIGSWFGSMREKSIPFGEKDAGLEFISWKAEKTMGSFGTEWKQTTRGFNALVTADDAAKIRAAIQQIQTSPGTGGFETLRDLGQLVRSKEYIQGMQGVVDGAWQAAKNNDSILQFINGVTQAATAASGGAASAATAKGGQTPTTESQLNELFGITGNKVDASSLEKAWKKAGSPTDSEDIAKILKNAGVEQSVISKIYADEKVPLGPTAEPITPKPKDETPKDKKVNIPTLVDKINKLSPEDKAKILAAMRK